MQGQFSRQRHLRNASPEAAQAFVEGLVNAANHEFDPLASSVLRQQLCIG